MLIALRSSSIHSLWLISEVVRINLTRALMAFIMNSTKDYIKNLRSSNFTAWQFKGVSRLYPAQLNIQFVIVFLLF